MLYNIFRITYPPAEDIPTKLYLVNEVDYTPPTSFIKNVADNRVSREDIKELLNIIESYPETEMTQNSSVGAALVKACYAIKITETGEKE